LVIVGVVFIFVILSRSIGNWFHFHLTNILETNLVLDLKKKYFNHILGLSYSFHTTHKTGSLISKLNRGRGAIESLTDTIIFNFTPLIFQLLVAGVSLIYLDYISTIVLGITIFAFIFFSLFMQKLQADANLKENQAEDFEKANISDIFTNVDSIKYFGKETTVKNKFAKIAEETKAASLKHWNYFRWLYSGQILILGIGTFFLIYFPIRSFIAGTLTLGSLVFIYTVYSALLGSLYSFVGGIRNFYRVMADVDALFLYGKIENEIKNKPNAKEIQIKNGEIVFKNISFSYGKRKIFENFSLKIPKEKNIAIVGHSGSGKTSLVKLLYRFYDLNSGEILIDDQNIKEVKQESLRGEMSIVPQECVLFDDTIYNNILFSKPGSTKDEVWNAIRFAQLDKTIENFPKKEKTIVGERGVKLSGGEKQRVSIARALLADKKILVLDEATSSLDSQTEHEIQEDLRKLMKGRTSIIIAHRLSTIMNADTIVVMDKGKIVQMGTHSQLIRQEGEYKKLWNLQKGGYIK
jgi:ATP-binding cassette, subfamily B, heavy metal transporter